MDPAFSGFDVPVEYVHAIADQLRSDGLSVESWLAECRVQATDLARPGGVVSYPSFQRLVRASVQLSGEPALGLFVGKRLGATTHGMVGAAAVHSSTVAQALDIVERFSQLRSSIITITHELDGGRVRTFFREALPMGDIHRPVMEAVVVSIKHLLDETTMGANNVRLVTFGFEEPEYAELTRDVFGCEVRYGQGWTGFEGPKEALDLPLKLADSEAFGEAARICQRELELIAQNASWGARVRRLFLETQAQQGGFPSLQVVARLLRVTPRTLHRRLVEEGTSYREQLESVRQTLAAEHLKANRFSLQEIAYRLGYTDLSNFRRAFKRWHGVTPSAFRGDRGALVMIELGSPSCPGWHSLARRRHLQALENTRLRRLARQLQR